MSKSLGNVISPSDITKKYGVDTLRLVPCNSLFTYFLILEYTHPGGGLQLMALNI